ncbi:MAG: hypothetical protein IJM74_03015 [Bacteroidales bacterium]|nr:hypothetical protein [Bacteroidales bacterium]
MKKEAARPDDWCRKKVTGAVRGGAHEGMPLDLVCAAWWRWTEDDD